ncbi:OadG family protein [bacterium]|nr:OadG family protein [bacterium]
MGILRRSKTNRDAMKVAMNFQNIVGGNGVVISMTGMLIVFCGLFIITLFIALLPRILTLVIDDQFGWKKRARRSVTNAGPIIEPGKDAETENEIAVAIGLVLHLEKERLNQLTTDEGKRDFWGTAGKLSATPKRRLYA